MTEEKHEFKTGAVRSKLDHVRYDLFSPQAMSRLAATYAEGARKYGDNNFRKGMEFSNLINHVLQHIFNYLEGDEGEPPEDSLAHACWGLMTLMEEEETHPELNDLYFHND